MDDGDDAAPDEEQSSGHASGLRVAGLLLVVLVVGAVAAGLQDRPLTADPAPTAAATPDPDLPTGPSTNDSPTPDREPSPSAPATAADEDRTRELLTRPRVAAEASREDLDRAVMTATTAGDWAFDERGVVPIADRDLASRPLVVGDVDVTAAGAVTLDVVWSVPVATDEDEVVFRVLPAAGTLGADFVLRRLLVEGEADDTAVVDPETAQLTVPLAGVDVDDGELRVRIRASYTVPGRSSLPGTEDPVGYGLLARSGDVTALGHWLPVPTFDPGPFADTGGDIGAFPAATWSLLVDHPERLVTGGSEGSCFGDRAQDRLRATGEVITEPAELEDAVDQEAPTGEVIECTWIRGAGLRDLSAVVVPEVLGDETFTYLDRPEDGVTLGLVDLHVSKDRAVLDEVAATWSLFHDLFGPLPWGEVDVVAVPLRPGAAGMEFPGMIWMDPEVLAADGGFGSYVTTHEVAHQWFHALVGNGSLSDPVVDESLAQYASWVAMAELHGQAAADAIDARYLEGRADRAADDGVPIEPAAQAVTAFSSESAYGAAVYGRAGHAWVEAERALGRDRVVAALRTIVDERRLAEVTAVELAERLDELDPEVAEIATEPWDLP